MKTDWASLKIDAGIHAIVRKYCREQKILLHGFVEKAIAEKLARDAKTVCAGERTTANK